LANATRETLVMADEVKTMLASAWRAATDGKPALARAVHEHDDRIDELNTNIKLYLSRIHPDALSSRDSRLQFGLLHFCSQLESIADIVDKGIGASVLKPINLRQAMSLEDRAELETLYMRVNSRMEAAISVLASRDRALAARFLKEGDELKRWCVEAQNRHYRRLQSADRLAVAASELFIDLFGSMRRISSQLSSIGHTFADGKSSAGAARVVEV
jgi:phosphate:Na+ symporter